MMSVKIKIQLNKKSLAKLSSILLVFLLSFSIFLVKTNSQSDETSNYFGYVLLIFSIVVIALAILAVTNTPIADFLLKNYKKMIIAFIIVFLLIYFIPKIPFKSITGLFVISPTTTITTTIPEVKEEALPGLVQIFSEVQPGKINSMKVSGKGVDLTEINLEVYRTLNDVRIVVSRLVSKPSSTMQDPSGNVYQYLEIEKTNIEDEDLKRVTIEFRVGKSWINDNGIDESTISLNRYQDNVWVKLSTAKTGEDDVFSYYETYTASLSLFSITGSSEPLAETTTTTTVTTTTTTPVMGPQETTTISAIEKEPKTTTIIPSYDCADHDTRCTLTTFTKTYPDGSMMTVNYQKPINFFDKTSGQYERVDTEIKSKLLTVSGRDYSFAVDKGYYEAYFRDMSSDVKNRPMAMIKDNYVLTFSPQDYIQYFPKQRTKQGRVGNRQQSNAIVSENQVTYPNQYAKVGTSGAFANLTYKYQHNQIKEELVIWDQDYLRERFASQCDEKEADIVNLVFPSIVRAYYSEDKDEQTMGIFYGSDRVKFKDFGLVANDEQTTSEEIYFTDEKDNIVYYIPSIYARDSGGSEILLNKTISMTRFGNLAVAIMTPFSWLNLLERVYPVYIDPTVATYYNKEIDHYSINNALNDYYFNATNAEQRANDIQNYWTKNDVCLGLHFDNTWHEFCGDSFDWVWYNSTDFATYMNLTGTAELKYAGYTVDTTVKYYLGEDYPEVRGVVTLENLGNKDISDSYIKIKTHDINVDATAEKDTVRINTTSFWEPWSGYSEYWLNESLNLVYTQDDLVSRKFAVFDNDTESWVELEWNDSYWRNDVENSMNYLMTVNKGSEFNAPVDLKLGTGTLNQNDIVTTNFIWADAVKQNFSNSEEYYNNLVDTIQSFGLDAYENGTQFYAQDLNMSLEMTSNNAIHVKFRNVFINDTALAEIQFRFIAWKFSCFRLPKVNSFDTFRCPENNTDLRNIIVSFSEQEIQLRERDIGTCYSIPYLLLNNYTGILENFTGTFNSKNISTTENENFRKGRIKLSSLFEVENFVDEWEFDVRFPDVNGNSHCINFPIPKHANLTINVTMMNSISNYTFGRSEFIIKNYTEGNSAIAHIKPYPCCDIKNIGLQTGQVCSG